MGKNRSVRKITSGKKTNFENEIENWNKKYVKNYSEKKAEEKERNKTEIKPKEKYDKPTIKIEPKLNENKIEKLEIITQKNNIEESKKINKEKNKKEIKKEVKPKIIKEHKMPKPIKFEPLFSVGSSIELNINENNKEFFIKKLNSNLNALSLIEYCMDNLDETKKIFSFIIDEEYENSDFETSEHLLVLNNLKIEDRARSDKENGFRKKFLRSSNVLNIINFLNYVKGFINNNSFSIFNSYFMEDNMLENFSLNYLEKENYLDGFSKNSNLMRIFNGSERYLNKVIFEGNVKYKKEKKIYKLEYKNCKFRIDDKYKTLKVFDTFNNVEYTVKDKITMLSDESLLNLLVNYRYEDIKPYLSSWVLNINKLVNLSKLLKKKLSDIINMSEKDREETISLLTEIQYRENMMCVYTENISIYDYMYESLYEINKNTNLEELEIEHKMIFEMIASDLLTIKKFFNKSKSEEIPFREISDILNKIKDKSNLLINKFNLIKSNKDKLIALYIIYRYIVNSPKYFSLSENYALNFGLE